jgi:GTP cyclohydrolase I
MVIIKDIELYSMCEHHMLPFFGKAHIAYIPNGHIVGLSKIPRIVDVFARRLQVQERLTHDILECINTTLDPKGVAVVIEASHMCMMMRGVQKQNSVTTTSGFRGLFEKTATRNEFMKLISSSLS